MNSLWPYLNKWSGWIISILSAGFFSYLIYSNRTAELQYTFLALAGLLFIYFLLFQKRLVLMCMLLFVPLSIRFAPGGEQGASIAFPSEMLLAALFGIFALTSVLRPTIDKKILLHPISILLLLDFLWQVVAVGFSTMPEVGIKRLLIRFCFMIVCYFMYAQWMRNRKNLWWLYSLYSVGLSVVILLTLKAHSQYNFTTKVSFSIPQPFFDDHTIYGACIAFVIPFFVLVAFKRRLFAIEGWKKWALWIGLAILLIGEFFSFSRAAWLSLIITALFGFLMRWKIKVKHILMLIATIVLMAFIFQDQLIEITRKSDAVSNAGDIESQIKSVTNLRDDASNLERLNRWVSAYNMFKERPVTGFGPGTYQFEYAAFQESSLKTYISTNHGNRGNAHSEYLTYLSETGFLGLLLFVIWVFVAIALGLRLIYTLKDPKLRLIALGITLGLVTFFIHGLFNSFLDQDKMAVLVFGSLAMLVGLDVYHKDHVPQEEAKHLS